jgi:potassium-transporting ATPase potassium-binding subunit
MITSWVLRSSLFVGILIALAVVLGEYLAKVFSGQRHLLSPVFGPLEKGIYKIIGVDPNQEMNWKTYTFHLLIFNLFGFLLLFGIQLIQAFLPLNPDHLNNVSWDTALNNAVSFVTNTNWQSYSPEKTVSYLVKMLGLTVQNFVSAASGIAVAVALITALIKSEVDLIGNFWVNLTRAVVYVLLPLAIILSLALVSQGVVQNLKSAVKIETVEGKQQVLATGPAASQIAIKELGTNGGGYFNANATHPYENPTPVSDYLQVLGLLIIAASFPFIFGGMVASRKQGWSIFLAMLILYLVGIFVILWFEGHGNPILAKLGIKGGINLEGKEVRIGTLASGIFANSTTATSTGAVNCMHDSLMPISGLVLIFNMAIGEVIFGGVGSGFAMMIMYVILAMFLVGLMIGRSPEMYGKKLDPYEMIMACIALLIGPIMLLILSAYSMASSSGIAGLGNNGPHGLSEVVYAYASGIGNNGSAFVGLNSGSTFYNLTVALAMFIGRYATLVPVLAIAGSMVKKKLIPKESRFPTTSLIFVLLLVFVVIFVGALTFSPILVLGPILEHLMMQIGQLF